MKKSELKERLAHEILILDGAMGTLLQPHLAAGACPDSACLDKPELVRDSHKAYVDAGADILNTNTFGATRIKLAEFGLSGQTREINRRAAMLAKEAAGDRALVAGNIAPTGRLVEPMGDLTWDEAYDVFREQALALAEGGVDLINLETFSDLKEVRIAVMAVRENTDLPVMAAMTFEESFLTFTGTDPETAANVLTSLGVDVLGVNCSTGPEPMLEVVGRYVTATDLPIFVEPNAGIPRLDRQGATYRISPEIIASFAEKFVQIGANIVGSCCGSTPEYTALIRKAVKDKKPLHRTLSPVLKLSSRVETLSVGPGLPFAVIGERINPTNREDLAEAIRNGRIGLLQKEAQEQTAQGAHLLDVNIGVPGVDEAALMGRVVRGIENVTGRPLVIDSTNPGAVEAALREAPGKPLINSVHGSAKSLESILPLAARHGAGLLCLAVGEKGIPATAEARLDVLRTLIEEAGKLGIPRDHLICDCLTLTVSAEQKRAEQTLRAIRMVKEELGLPTVLGVSNISFGLPDRSLINATFLAMAMASGLDAAIINPADARMMETVRAASVLTVRDRDSRLFVAAHVKKKKKSSTAEAAVPGTAGLPVYDAVIAGNRDEIPKLVEEALAAGKSALEINEKMLIPAIREVGGRYDRKEVFLPQMILAAETMQRAFSVLEPHFGSGEVRSEGTVVMCTVKGDVHDIGKNIVCLFLKNQGFRVIDLGKDVSAETIVRAAEEYRADVVGLSALMTTTMTGMPEVISAIRDSGSGAKVMVGGAVVTAGYAREIGADAYAKDAVSAVERVRELAVKK